jgi:hypothetical protein
MVDRVPVNTEDNVAAPRAELSARLSAREYTKCAIT